jgi:PDZ domain-containing protein
MDSSKQYATAAALRRLGYEVKVKGTGAVITGLAEGGPSTGVLEVGDAVVAAGDAPIASQEDLVAAIGSRQPGELLTLTIEKDRSGTREERQVTLGAREDDAQKGFLGVTLATRDLSFEFPFTVSIDSGQVGGPSAGLAFSLGMIDVLTPGDLTGGTAVATTGTIDPSGRVGNVGGIKQKTYAVREAGATLFLVPKGEVEEAQRYAGDGLTIAPVETLDEALQVIAEHGGDTRPVEEMAAANKATR